MLGSLKVMMKDETKNLAERRKYRHLEIKLCIFRLVLYKMRKKYYLCIEISIGWNKRRIK